MYLLDNIGLDLTGVSTKSDITSAIPRISIGTDQRRHTDFSERDTFGQNSFHHGRGQRDLLNPLAFADAENVMTWWSTQVTLCPLSYVGQNSSGAINLAGYVVDQVAYSGNLFFLVFGNTASTNALYLFNNGTGQFDTVSAGLDTTNGDPGDLHVWEKSAATSPILLVAQGEAVNARYFNGTTWSDLGVPANFFATFDNKCVRADNLNELYLSTDATNAGSWGTAITVGDAAYPIRGMLAGYKGALWIGKDDGIYAMRYDQTGAAYVVTKEIDLTGAISSNNGQAMREFGGNLYISVQQGLIKFDGLTVQYVGPDQAQDPSGSGALGGSIYQTQALGKITYLAHDNNYLYAGVNDDSTNFASHVMVWNGTGWHKMATEDGVQIRSVFYTPAYTTTGVLGYPVIWYSYGTGSIKYKKLPRFSVDPLQDPTLEYEPSGTLTTSWYDAGLIDIDKVFFDLVVRVLRLYDSDTGGGLKVSFELDDVAETYVVGTARHSPEQTFYFPDNSQLDPNAFGKKIRFSFEFIRGTDSTLISPVLLSYATRFVVRPHVRYGWNLTCKIYENMHAFNRQQETWTAQEFREFLYARRDKHIPVHLDEATQPESLTNLVTNPSFEVEDFSMFPLIGTVSYDRTAQYKTHGVYSMKISCTLPNDTAGIQLASFDVAAGRRVFASAHVYVQAGDTVTMEILNEVNTVVASYTWAPAIAGTHDSRFTRGTASITAASTGTWKVRVVRTAAVASAPTYFYVDGVEVIHSGAMTRDNEFYIDGDQLRCRWNGEPHRSTSTRQAGYFCYITGLTEVVRYIEDKAAGILPQSEITIQLRETL